MKEQLRQLFQQFAIRRYWIQQLVVTAFAAAVAWQIGDMVLKNGGVVAAIVASLTVRSSLHKSTREGLAQIVGSTVGAGAALMALHFFGLGVITVGITVLISLVAARVLHLGEVATINVPVTALIVIGPGANEINASNRLISTIVGALIAIAASTFAHPKTPAGRTIDRISSLTDRCSVLLAQMAEGLVEDYSLDRSGRWLARARLLVEEIPSIRNQAVEARAFAKWLPPSRSRRAEILYLRGIALEHTIIQVRSTARTLYDLRLYGGVSLGIPESLGSLLSSVSYALSVSAEEFRFNPYKGVKDPLTSEIRSLANSLTTKIMNEGVRDREVLSSAQLARLMAVISSVLIIADSMDQNSPSIHKVPTPQGSTGQQILTVSPLEQARTWQNRVYRLLPGPVRKLIDLSEKY
jgi:uncharacterized membrane protein YgaE (UPF0421/DUF939 family)